MESHDKMFIKFNLGEKIMDSEDFKREFNISAKIIYRKWLMEAIEKNEYESFKDCVLNLGIEWHVIRTVKKVKR